MRALHRKLFRDLWQMRGQALAISLVIAAGVAMFLLALSTFQSLRLTQETYYSHQRFAEVFANLERAPEWLAHDIAAISGVAQVQTRVVRDVVLDVEGLPEPAVGRLISLPEGREPLLNDIFLLRGRRPETGRPDEVVVNEPFAEAHELVLGDTVAAVINGSRRQLEVVGVALSPEYIYGIRPGELMPDDSRFGVFWMGRQGLSSAFDMEGGFNDVALGLLPRASSPEVIARLDQLLEPYGGLGAIPRDLQVSHWYLNSELEGLRGSAIIVPIIFLGVAAFLLNVVLSRMVAVQREQIAALKALGYPNLQIGLHYSLWSILVSLIGGALGTGAGAWLGSGLTELYTQYFRFPYLEYRLAPSVVILALAISLAAAVVGALGSVRRAVRLPPAEALRPAPPAAYRTTLVERLGLGRLLSQPARIVVRNLERQPIRALLSITGIAFAGAIMVVGTFSLDAIDVILDLQFNAAQRQDITISFFLPVSSGALHSVRSMPGVLAAEPQRAVPVRLRYRHRSRQTAVTGLPADGRLQRVVDDEGQPLQLAAEGLTLSAKLAELLAVEAGDTVTLEVLEGARPVKRVPVASVVDDFLGTSAYMQLDALHRLMREGGALSGAVMLVDDAAADTLYRRLKATPAVAGVALKRAAIENFRSTVAENLGLMTTFNLLFSSIIAFGVIYNGARISLSERSRDLASLRVIGLTRREISAILLGELAVLTLVATPLGLLLGRSLAGLTVAVYDNELYRLPLVVAPKTYALAAVTVLVASVVSGLVVRRRLDHLDLVSVLKTRE
ncbi:MAG: FtsX-like permease family protein [Acidobacteriota bacterium]|nr:FtsX-like permease family protein [Acidobacteriota bacterium]